MTSNTMLKSPIFLLLILSILLIQTACQKEPDLSDSKRVSTYQADVVLEWSDLFLKVERYAGGYRPGPAPRAMAYIGLAVYEAALPGMPAYRSLESEFQGLSLPDIDQQNTYHWPSVIHGVYATLMPRFFADVPVQTQAEIALLTSQLNEKYQNETGIESFNLSFAHGAAIADQIWAWSATDPYGHDAYKNPFGNYDWQTAYQGPGDWVPTLPGPGKPMFPFWGQVRTFALDETEKLCLPPLPYSDSPFSAFYSQGLEVYAQNTSVSPFIREWIGEFWSDDLINLTFSPGPRWLAIAHQVMDEEQSDLETAVVTIAKLGLALNDASVACWHSKYVYNVERPESYIQRIIDPAWDSNLSNPLTGETGITPSFPAYPSGHSTMGAAAAEILGAQFGYSYSMVDKCHEKRTEFIGTPRNFDSFYDMALENGWSRVLLGVHFRMDCDEGVRFGTAIGRRVNKLPWKL